MSKLATLALAFTLIAFSDAVLAHAKLLSSTPANNAQLNESPGTLTLHFNKHVQLAVLTLVGAAKQLPIKIDPNAKAAPDVRANLPLLVPGAYQVKWRAMSSNDGHVMTGSLTFTVLAPK